MVTSDKKIHIHQFISGKGATKVETREMEENSEDHSTSSNCSSQDPLQGESKDSREKVGGKTFHCNHWNSIIKGWSMFRRHRIRCRMRDTVPTFPTNPMTYPNLPVSPELGNIYIYIYIFFFQFSRKNLTYV